MFARSAPIAGVVSPLVGFDGDRLVCPCLDDRDRGIGHGGPLWVGDRADNASRLHLAHGGLTNRQSDCHGKECCDDPFQEARGSPETELKRWPRHVAPPVSLPSF